MPRTSPSSATVLPAALSRDLAAPGGLCTVHRPNLLLRPTTLAKLFATDYWGVLDSTTCSSPAATTSTAPDSLPSTVPLGSSG